MRRKISGNSWIKSIFQTTIWKLRLTPADIATVIALRKLPNIYQLLYYAFYQQPIYHQEGMDGDGRPNQMREYEEEDEVSNLKAEEATVEMVKDTVEE